MWSVARSSQAPKDSSGYAAAAFTVKVVKLLIAHGVYFTIENPLSSKLWQWDP